VRQESAMSDPRNRVTRPPLQRSPAVSGATATSRHSLTRHYTFRGGHTPAIMTMSRALADVCERTTIGGGTPSIHVLGTCPRTPCDRPTTGSMTFYPNLGFQQELLDFQRLKDRETGSLSFGIVYGPPNGPYFRRTSKTLRIGAFKRTDSFSINWIIPNGDGSGRRTG
jgi:hypothetical protein